MVSFQSIHCLVKSLIILNSSWIPFVIYEFVMLISMQFKFLVISASSDQTSISFHTLLLLQNLFTSLHMTYPLVDPIIYTARFPEIHRYLFYYTFYSFIF